MSPRISAIVPVYNGERYLREALESALGQTRVPDEILVIDDGSTDDTAAIAGQFASVQVLRQDNLGAGAARNRGVAAATGDILVFLDADDLWLPGKTAAQLAALDADATLALVFGQVEQFTSGLDYQVDTTAMAGHLPSAMMMRRSAYFDFDEDKSVPEFASWFLAAREAGLSMQVLPEVVARRRLHPDNKGRGEAGAHRQYLLALKASLDRRRARAEENR